MTWKNTADRYGALSIGLHWLMLLLLIAVYACIELREIYPKGSDPREALKIWHFMLGLTVFALVCVRMGLRAVQLTPRILPPPVQWQQLAANTVHVALYVFMFAMPLIGWSILSAEGDVIPFSLPPLLGESEETAELMEEIHEVIGTVGYFLIALHAFAGLYHHYVIRDNTLMRIVPWRRR